MGMLHFSPWQEMALLSQENITHPKHLYRICYVPNNILGAWDRAVSKEAALARTLPKSTAQEKGLLTISLRYYSLEQEWETENIKQGKRESRFQGALWSSFHHGQICLGTPGHPPRSHVKCTVESFTWTSEEGFMHQLFLPLAMCFPVGCWLPCTSRVVHVSEWMRHYVSAPKMLPQKVRGIWGSWGEVLSSHACEQLVASSTAGVKRQVREAETMTNT